MESTADRYDKVSKVLDWTVDRLNNDHIQEMEKYNKYPAEFRT